MKKTFMRIRIEYWCIASWVALVGCRPPERETTGNNPTSSEYTQPANSGALTNRSGTGTMDTNRTLAPTDPVNPNTPAPTTPQTPGQNTPPR